MATDSQVSSPEEPLMECSLYLTPETIFNTILEAISGEAPPRHLVFNNVAPSKGQQISDLLDKSSEIEASGSRINYDSVAQELSVLLMPTHTHNGPQSWLIDQRSEMVLQGFLTRQERKTLNVAVGTTFTGFSGEYIGSRQEPDAYIQPKDEPFPTVVMNSGYSLRVSALSDRKDLWLRGGAPHVRLVIIIKWKMHNNGSVSGWVETWEPGFDGNPTRREREEIFPSPPAQAASTQTLTITRGDLFGASIPPDRNPADRFDLSVSDLREVAARFIRRDGFTPA